MKKLVVHIGLLCLLLTSLVWGQEEAVRPNIYLETSMGDITIELNRSLSPLTVDNYLSYVDEQFYDELIFHRVMDGFMIQGGGFDDTLTQQTTHAPIINESYNGWSNLRGTIAMARTSDPCSATSQFFINHVDNTFLDRENAEDGYGYCVFGEVLTGLDVVDAIAAVATSTQSNFDDVPVTPVYSQRIRRLVMNLIADPNVTLESGLTDSASSLAITVENISDDDLDSPITVALYLSSDPCSVFDDLESWIATEDISSLSAGDTMTVSLSWTSPSVAGDYYLLPMVYDADLDPTTDPNISIDLTDQILGALPYTVLAKGPDLVVTELSEDPCDMSVTYEPGTTVPFPVTIENIGGQDAVGGIDPNDPNDLMWVSVYMSDDPCWVNTDYWTAPNLWPDPCASSPLVDSTLLSDFSFYSLAAGETLTEETNFVASQPRGTYYLVAVVDDGNNVLEYDETNNISDVVTLTIEYDPCDIVVDTCKMKASKDRGGVISDSFVIKGSVTSAFTPTLMDGTDWMEITVGTYTETLSRTSFTKIGDSKYSYKNQEGITLVLLDLDKGTFRIKADNIDLTGTTAPVDVELVVQGYRGIESVGESIINKSKSLPLQYSQGIYDSLAVDFWKIRTDRPKNYNNDVLVLKGVISTKVTPDMADEELTIKWGNSSATRTYTIPGLQQRGDRQVYVYHGQAKSASQKVHAVFDFEKNQFSIVVRKAYSVAVPSTSSPASLTLQFATDDSNDFDETISVY